MKESEHILSFSKLNILYMRKLYLFVLEFFEYT